MAIDTSPFAEGYEDPEDMVGALLARPKPAKALVQPKQPRESPVNDMIRALFGSNQPTESISDRPMPGFLSPQDRVNQGFEPFVNPPSKVSATQREMGETPGHFANVRYNNPGAMYPGKAAQMFGSTGTGIIGGGHKIALFPTPVHGAAANMQNVVSGGYVGMPIGQAISKWSGGSRSTIPGFDPRAIITPEMTQDPKFMVQFMRSVAGGEAPGRYPMTEEQWNRAFNWYKAKRPE